VTEQAFRRPHSEPAPKFLSDFVQALHRALRSYCGAEAAQRFWTRFPNATHALTAPIFAEFAPLADGASSTSLAYVTQVLSGLEDFLCAEGLSTERFVDSLITHGGEDSFIDSRLLLRRLSPFLVSLFRMTDPHRVILSMFHAVGPQFVDGLLFDELAYEETRDVAQRRAIVLVGFSALWQGHVSACDGQLFGARLLQKAPLRLGLPEFERVQCLADARTLRQVVQGSDVSLQEGSVLIDARRVGRTLSFRQFCADHDLEPPSYGQPERDVIMVERDWVCARDPRAVLRAGCAYGAPVYLFDIQWRPEHDRMDELVQFLVQKALRYGNDEAQPPRAERCDGDAPQAQGQERAVLNPTSPSLRCVFLNEHTSIYVGGTYVCRGVPALILRNCLRVLSTTGRTQFEFREFKRDREIASHPKNTGFEVRLRRLRDALSATHCGVHIEPAGRGRFTLHCMAPVEFEERQQDCSLDLLDPRTDAGEH